MANAGINTQLDTTNYVDSVAQAIITLLQTNFNGIKAYYGHRPLGEKFWQTGQGQLSFPCFMVEPTRAKAVMPTTGKWDRKTTFNIFFYVLDQNPDKLVTIQTAYMEALVKLFSNNAKDDVATASPTYNYKIYSGYWYDSTIEGMQYSPLIAWGDLNAKWIRAGIFTVSVVNRIVE